jgi:hypothetical protein
MRALPPYGTAQLRDLDTHLSQDAKVPFETISQSCLNEDDAFNAAERFSCPSRLRFA